MAYIIKNTSGLINTRVTDTGRQKLSEGNFRIAYFQVGDSEVCYDKLGSSYNQANSMVMEPQFNGQNSTGVPNSNKQYVKYPYLVDADQTNTYGIPYMDSTFDGVYNRAALRGFFSGETSATTIDWKALVSDQYVISSNYVVYMSGLTGSNQVDLVQLDCNAQNDNLPSIGDFVTIYFDGKGCNNCECFNLPTPTPTPTPSQTPNTTVTPTPTISPSPTDICASPTPTPSVTQTPCLTPTPSAQCPLPPQPDCFMDVSSCYAILTYKVIDVCNTTLTLDRPTPNYSGLNGNCEARVLVYPAKMTDLYDSLTPQQHWDDSVIDFESVCNTDQLEVKIWNMNIPWTENPAGLQPLLYEGYQDFGSANYIGSKEYLGYNGSEGQTSTDTVNYYNSFAEQIVVTPEEQKAIAIIHYTNQTIDFFYGEKFATEPFDSTNPDDTTGQARNFKLHIPWIMWHKNPECCYGQTFWIDPPGFDGLDLFQVQYMKSSINSDMNQPGLRYYNLWDTNPNTNGIPNRVGKVYPDSQMIVIDDEELVAALSYKSNRNWTLPAPQVSLITPNTCDSVSTSNGLLTGSSETLFITYTFSSDTYFTNSLHCNYYSKVVGNNNDCTPDVSKNVAVRFGGEFGCLTQPDGLGSGCTTCNLTNGFYAQNFQILAQLVPTGTRPDPTLWRVIDFTSQISGSSINGFITQSGLTGSTFVVTKDDYDVAPFYVLNSYIPLVPIGTVGPNLNFGDEYYFYGSLDTDIQATIYEMKYKINLSQDEFLVSQNPTWTPGSPSYISEISLLDVNKDVLVVSKLQSPTLRQGIQQYLVKLDF